MSNTQYLISNPLPGETSPLSTGLQFLKLGGSVITDKTKPGTARLDVLARLAGEIAEVKKEIGVQFSTDLRLIVGHGSGSFGHVPAKKYGTRQGVWLPEQWRGFAEVWREADLLNRLVVDALIGAGLPAIRFAVSGSVTARAGQVVAWDLSPLRAALDAGLLPVVYGDVVFDQAWGGTILSTEDIFAHLARELHPIRVLNAGIEEGVWADYPACTRLIPEITPENFEEVGAALGGSSATDVTGGMASKVREMLGLAEVSPGLEGWIFSGAIPGRVAEALRGKTVGTRIRAE
ncbi:MAG: isopentenyl phosphate kinase [Anaerolineales bacterium]